MAACEKCWRDAYYRHLATQNHATEGGQGMNEGIRPQIGIWKLTAPDGREFFADSPIHCCGQEMKSRLPDEVMVSRLFAMMRSNKCYLCEEGEATQTLAEGTPAEIKVCVTCAATIKDSLQGRGDKNE